MPPDRRTLWLAAAAWVGAAGGWAAGSLGRSLPLTACLLLAPLTVILIRRPRYGPVMVIGAAAAVVGLIGADVRQAPSPAVSRMCDLAGTATGTGRQVATAVGQASEVAVPMNVHTVVCGDQRWQVDLPARVLVLIDDLPESASPGQDWRLRGRLEPREPLRSDLLVRAEGPVDIVGEPHGVAAFGATLRRHLDEATTDAPGADPDAAALVSGIALGDESRQSPELAWWMRLSGLAHLTAVSGGNFVIAVGMVVLAARWVGFGLGLQSVAGGVALLGYALVVGPQPSVMRAAVMAAVGLVGIALGGPARGLPVLGATVTFLLLLSPELAWSPGFMLSVAATASLQSFTHPLAARLGFLPGPARLPLAVAVTAQLATAPILLALGASVSWVAVPANLVVAPLIAPITVLGLVAAAIGTLLGVAVVTPSVLCGAVVVRVAAGATWLLHSPWGAVVGQAAIAALFLAWGITRAGARWRAPLAILVAVAAVWSLGRTGPQKWRLIACDVGQGTAVLINTGQGALMVDTGPADSDLDDCLTRMGSASLDAVVLSHHHIDHVGGLPRVLSVRRPAAIYGPGGAPASSTAAGVADLAGARGGLQSLTAGQRLEFGPLSVTILWPPPGRSTPTDEVNNGSAVLLLEWPDGVRALLPGDIEPESQRRLMASWQLPPVDVVVIPHHGSDHQDPRFAQWLRPAVAIASAGAGNSYGHPAAETVAEYHAVGAAVRRTDTDGAVVVSGDAGGLSVSGG